tara:strand:+ start:109 stop:579 length:471 start_codon:yes stop_codon:yes gene_type:complete
VISLYYFAYGSNMNPRRVRSRGIAYRDLYSGKLAGYELKFNKFSTKRPGSAANVIKSQDSCTQGVLYLLAKADQICVMDLFEGFPSHYNRKLLPIKTGSRTVSAWVYIANSEFIREGLPPPRWYLDHLLEGKKFLSVDYYSKLQGRQCLPDTNQEP